jgi:hypothetical protein
MDNNLWRNTFSSPTIRKVSITEQYGITMPRKRMSTMTTDDFIAATAAVAHTYSHMAQLLGKSPSIISRYVNGQGRGTYLIPQNVADDISRLVNTKAQQIEKAGGRLDYSDVVASIKAWRHANEVEPAWMRQHATTDRLMGRLGPQDRTPLPAYRMNTKRFRTYLLALNDWQAHVRFLVREYPRQRCCTHRRLEEYRLEIADIKLLAATAPFKPPYDVRMQRSHWKVVSRALRYAARDDKVSPHSKNATALRAHWSKYRELGYPLTP